MSIPSRHHGARSAAALLALLLSFGLTALPAAASLEPESNQNSESAPTPADMVGGDYTGSGTILGPQSGSCPREGPFPVSARSTLTDGTGGTFSGPIAVTDQIFGLTATVNVSGTISDGTITGTTSQWEPGGPLGVMTGTLVGDTLTLRAAFPGQGVYCPVDADVTMTRQAAPIEVTIADAPDPVLSGGSVTYTVGVTNSAEAAVLDVTLDANVPEGTAFVSTTTSQGIVEAPAPGGTGPISVTIGVINGNATVTVTVVVMVTAVAGTSLSFVADPAFGSAKEATTFVVASGDPYFAWNPPVTTPENQTPPPLNGRIQTGTAAAAAHEALKVEQTPPPTVIGYKVYRATSPNVQVSPNNIFGTFPPNQTNTGTVSGLAGSYFVVTACYSNGQESAPSNEVSSGAGEPVITSVDIKKGKLVAVGRSFAAPIQVTIDGLSFSAAAALKKNNTKVVQKGNLSNGQTAAQYLDTHTVSLVCYRNSTGATTCVEVR